MTITKRMRINISKTSKGHSYDTTFEITSNDPSVGIASEMQTWLRHADGIAREEIIQRQDIDDRN